MPGKLMDYFNRSPRIGTLSTASRKGDVDAAVFGSPRMVDEKTVVMGLGKDRSLQYLQENPHAVYLIMEPGKTLMEWKGLRVYLEMTSAVTSGPKLEDYKAQVAKAFGADAANMMHAAVTFTVTEVRPLVDMGQGWEKSI